MEKSALGRFTELKRDKFLFLNRVFYNNYMCMFLLQAYKARKVVTWTTSKVTVLNLSRNTNTIPSTIAGSWIRTSSAATLNACAT